MFRVEYSRLRFLVVDDNTYMRRILKTLLHGFGAREVFEAEDGASALDAFASHYPDIVFTDWEMPLINGIDMTKLMRCSDNSVNPFVPIIMVSVHSERHRVIEARDAGVTEFLVKPLSATALHQRILGVVAHPRPFIKTASYFGPDRRRTKAAEYTGPERRKGEEESQIIPAKPVLVSYSNG
ncbi:two-component system response regulator [Alsobacter soli]|uniref:Two-component system response regulator n=1 Tax=Alsobacter soli TaxID=2109933 RepID=A0A2T1HQP9_9HYPH|nr:response regulator [Alsobacter soli]PSC03978.1 two-component system response regulator [Alsobacter soli]